MRFDEAHIAKLQENARRHSENYRVGKLIRQTDRALFMAILYELENPKSRLLNNLLHFLTTKGKHVGDFL